jgi:hypothetical protein
MSASDVTAFHHTHSAYPFSLTIQRAFFPPLPFSLCAGNSLVPMNTYVTPTPYNAGAGCNTSCFRFTHYKQSSKAKQKTLAKQNLKAKTA